MRLFRTPCSLYETAGPVACLLAGETVHFTELQCDTMRIFAEASIASHKLRENQNAPPTPLCTWLGRGIVLT